MSLSSPLLIGTILATAFVQPSAPAPGTPGPAAPAPAPAPVTQPAAPSAPAPAPATVPASEAPTPLQADDPFAEADLVTPPISGQTAQDPAPVQLTPAPAPQTVAPTITPVPAATIELAAPPQVVEEIVPHEIKWRLDLAVGGGMDMPLDKSYGVFAGDESLPMGRLDIDVGMSFPIGDRGLYMGGRLGYRMFAWEFYDVHGVWLPTYRNQEINVGARLGFAVLDGVEPYMDVSGGPSFWRSDEDESLDLGTSALEPDGSPGALVPTHLEARNIGFVKGVAGLQLYLPRKWLPRKEGSRVTVGLDVNVGYVWRPTFDLTLVQKDSVEGEITKNFPTFGSLDTSGITWSAGLFLRVM